MPKATKGGYIQWKASFNKGTWPFNPASCDFLLYDL